jgi:hypothetical protein
LASDQVIRLINAVAQLFGVFVWPAVLLFVVVQFRTPLTELLKNAGQFSLKGAGFEASITRRREEAVAALGVLLPREESIATIRKQLVTCKELLIPCLLHEISNEYKTHMSCGWTTGQVTTTMNGRPLGRLAYE